MDALGTKRGDFAITEHISDRTLAVPFFPNMTGAQVSRGGGALESHFESKSE
jgi:dTDP-4-amino-4,6-dideoxygalactose transaminase